MEKEEQLELFREYLIEDEKSDNTIDNYIFSANLYISMYGELSKKINDSPDIEAERECRNYKRMTQADRIRAMSDEELAEHFSELIKDTYENEYCKDVNDWLKWLQSEVEE